MGLKWDEKRIIISLTIQDTKCCTEHNTIIKNSSLKKTEPYMGKKVKQDQNWSDYRGEGNKLHL